MSRVSGEIAPALQQGGGALAVRDHPLLARAVQREARAGRLVMILPGVYVATTEHLDPDVRIRAAACWYPAAVFTGAAAARLTFWPTARIDRITLSVPRLRAVPAGFDLTREVLPAALIADRHGLRVSVPALTALDLGGPGIDEALLRRACGLNAMHEALSLTPRRNGNRERRRLLHDSRDEPWSEAERLCHALLRRARIGGWRANHHVRIGRTSYFVDVAFAGLKVAVEVDGWEVHSRRDAFEQDRRKGDDLVAAGWLVLRFTWRQLEEDPDWVLHVLRSTLGRVAKSADVTQSRRSVA